MPAWRFLKTGKNNRPFQPLAQLSPSVIKTKDLPSASTRSLSEKHIRGRAWEVRCSWHMFNASRTRRLQIGWHCWLMITWSSSTLRMGLRIWERAAALLVAEIGETWYVD